MPHALDKPEVNQKTVPSDALPGTPRDATRYKWRVVAMLWCICFFNYADRQAIFAVFPNLKQEFVFDPVQLGLIGSAFMWVYAAGSPLAGIICDRFRRKDLILGGCLFWSLVTMLTGRCSRLWQFATVRAFEGSGEMFYFPASMSLLSDYHGRTTRSRALSLHQSSVYIGTIIGSWAGAWFAVRLGWRAGFYCFGTAGMLLVLALSKSLREPVRGEAERCDDESQVQHRADGQKLPIAQTLRLIFRAPQVCLLMLAFVFANFVAAVFLTWTPTFLVEKFHFHLTAAGLSGTLFIHLSSALSVPFAGWLADKLTRRFATGRMAVQATGLVLGAAFVVLVAKTASVSMLLVSMSAFGLYKGFYDSGIFASVYDAVPPEARGTTAGIMNTVGWSGGALGPLFVGLISKYGAKPTPVQNMSDAIAFCGGAYLLAALLVGAAICSRRARAKHAKGLP